MGIRTLTECGALGLRMSGMGVSWAEDGKNEASQAEDGEYGGLCDRGEEQKTNRSKTENVSWTKDRQKGAGKVKCSWVAVERNDGLRG